MLSSCNNCRCSSDWLRLARFTNTWLTPWRSLAWSTAASTAVDWTSLNALTMSTISDVCALTSSGATSSAEGGPASPRSRLTSPASRTSASSVAASRSPASSRTRRLRKRREIMMEAMTAIRPTPPAMPSLTSMPMAVGVTRWVMPRTASAWSRSTAFHRFWASTGQVAALAGSPLTVAGPLMSSSVRRNSV